VLCAIAGSRRSEPGSSGTSRSRARAAARRVPQCAKAEADSQEADRLPAGVSDQGSVGEPGTGEGLAGIM
jgi:hypothetical protein